MTVQKNLQGTWQDEARTLKNHFGLFTANEGQERSVMVTASEQSEARNEGKGIWCWRGRG